MFVGVPLQGGLKQQWGDKMQFLVISGAYIYGTFRAKTNITNYYTATVRHEVLCRLSTDPKIRRTWP